MKTKFIEVLKQKKNEKQTLTADFLLDLPISG